MKEIFFKCTLESDIVLNSKLATEGNMTTLDYIPGSNFLGIAAKELYKTLNPEDALSIFHSGEVSFGDAIISNTNELYYPLPFDLMMAKGKDELGKYPTYLQHLINTNNHPKDEDDFKVQLKQKRTGYVSSSGKTINKIRKTFALKSAQDADERRSKEGAMFGFESLKKDQEFIFSIKFENERFVEKVLYALIGKRRIGKSKTAEYGQVDIQQIEPPQKIEAFQDTNYTLVYAQSNLCFFEEAFAQPTYQPTSSQLGLQGKICWKKSQIRTYSYAPWNGQRNTTDTQRNCIAAGSVFYIEGKNEPSEKSVGEFQAEGLGRIIVNPVFLKGEQETAISYFFPITKKSKEGEVPKSNKPEIVITDLGKLLKRKYNQKVDELELSKAIQEELSQSSKNLKRVSPSQWGSIRNHAMKAKNIESLNDELFLIVNENGKEKRIGYLTYGVAYDKYWGKNREELLKGFQKIFNENKKFGSTFIAKFAAEMAKSQQRKKEVTNAE